MENSNKMHILVVSQYFFPELFRVNDICSDLVKRGFKVTVLTGYPNYPEGDIYDGYSNKKIIEEFYNGINIIRVPLVPRKQNKLNLILNYLSFMLSGNHWVETTDLEVDAVFIYEVSPMTQAIPGVKLSKKLGVPCYIYVMDLWPENIEIVAGIHSKIVISPIQKMVDYIYEHCDKILTSSRSFIGKITASGVSADKIFYWPQFAEDYYYPVSADEADVTEIPDDNILNLTFAGNVGFAQGLDILPKVASSLKQKDFFARFNIIGDGRYLGELIKLTQKLNVTDYFNFIDRQPGERIKDFFAVSDAALIILSNNELFEMTIPAKLQSCLACGVPIIASANGEIKSIIEEGNVGYCSPSGDVNKLVNNILMFNSLTSDEKDRLANNGLAYYLANFDKTKLMDELEDLLLQEGN